MFTSALSWLVGKVQLYAALAGTLVLALGYAFLRGRKSGVTSTTAKIERESQRVSTEIDRVDAQRPDLDAALSRLRKRSSTKP